MKVVLLLVAFGCGEIPSPVQPLAADASHLFWSLTLAHHAITLSTSAPYDTLQLVATPRDAYGAPLPATGQFTFQSSDRSVVQVDSTGLLRAVSSGSGITVLATLTKGNLSQSDTVVINVTAGTATSPPTKLSIHPVGADTAKLAEGFFFNQAALPVVATDAAGDTLANLAVDVRSSDTTVAVVCGVSSTEADICARTGSGYAPGTARIIATTTTYGVSLADTITVRVTLPMFTWSKILTVAPSIGTAAVPSFVPSSMSVAPGATVLWVNAPVLGGTGQPVDITFDDPSNVASPDTTSHFNCLIFGFPTAGAGTGNIAAFGDTTSSTLTDNMCRSRRFPVVGTYHYHSLRTGATGTLVVTDQSPSS